MFATYYRILECSGKCNKIRERKNGRMEERKNFMTDGYLCSSSQPNPADLKTICGKNAGQVQDSISEKCSDDKQAALKYFSNTCSSNGHKVGTCWYPVNGLLATCLFDVG